MVVAGDLTVTGTANLTATNATHLGSTAAADYATQTDVSNATNGMVSTAGLTANTIPKASDADTLADSLITDSGSLVSIDSTLNVTNGNVGIGTNAPTANAKLHVVGGDIYTDNNEGLVSYTTGGGATVVARLQSDDKFHYGNSSLVVSGSLVGIGTNDPAADLHVVGSDPVLKLTDTDDDRFFQVQKASAGVFMNVDADTSTYDYRFNGATKVSQRSNGGMAIGTGYAGSGQEPADGLIVVGNVGIGDATPNAKLDVEGTNSTGVSILASGLIDGMNVIGEMYHDFASGMEMLIGTSYQNITNYTELEAEHVTMNATGGYMTVEYAGLYEGSVGCSFGGDGGGGYVYEIAFHTNQVEVHNIEIRRKTSSADTGDCGRSGSMRLQAGDRVDIKVKCDNASKAFTPWKGNVRLLRIGPNN